MGAGQGVPIGAGQRHNKRPNRPKKSGGTQPAHIKQNWPYQTEWGEEQYHVHKRENEIKSTHATTNRPQQGGNPLYAESVNMVEGLVDEEVDQYLKENPKIVPLFEVDVSEAIFPYIVQTEDVGEEPDKDTILELRQA